MLLNWKKTHPDPVESVYMLATAVSSKILKTMAQMEGFNFEVSVFHSYGVFPFMYVNILCKIKHFAQCRA